MTSCDVREPSLIAAACRRGARAALAALVAGVFCVFTMRAGNAQEPEILLFKYGRYVFEGAALATKGMDLWDWLQQRLPGHTPTATEEDDLGLKYLYGRGVKPDAQQARIHFENAIRGGDRYAKVNLGIMYVNGDVARLEGRVMDNSDRYRGWSLFRDAADQTHDRVAEYDLGVSYEDYGYRDNAIAWYDAAARQGYADASTAKANLCSQGGMVLLTGLRMYRNAPNTISYNAWQRYCST